MTATIGRPRSTNLPRRGESTVAEILDAAAELFTTYGFAATSTRMIADSVGVKQATLYYYFARKQDILAALLAKPMQPALRYSRQLARRSLPSHLSLYALARLDATTLAADPWNIGALYALPELKLDWMADFRRQQAALRRAYRRPILSGVTDGTFQTASVEMATSLALALVESVITMRVSGVPVNPAVDPAVIAAGVLRTLQCPNRLVAAAETADLG